MGKKRVIGVIALVLLVILLVLSVFSYIATFGILSFSGFSDLDITIFSKQISVSFSSIKSFDNSSIILQIASLVEMILIILLILGLRTKKVITENHVSALPNIPEKHSRAKTDLDTLYDVLKKEKKIKISKIVKSFNITEDLAMEWCKILESGNLARMNYPRMAEPELTIIE